jgi:hypothetical protein
MALRILPGDEEVFHRRYTDKFNSWYGEGIDAKQIYICCGSNFVKFHAVFPEQAWLVERICRVYKNIDINLDIFQASFGEERNLDAEKLKTGQLSKKYKDNDPFTYFQDNELEQSHRRIYVELISTLKNFKGDNLTASLYREQAHSVLQVACEHQRKELVDELTSQETYDTLSAIHVGASTNIYTARSAIVVKEELFAADLVRIREALAESEHDTNESESSSDGSTPSTSAAPSQLPLAPVIQSTEAGGSGTASYTVARSGPEWTVRRR